MCAAEMISGREPYTYQILKPSKTRDFKTRASANAFTFDTSKIDQIFDRLYKDGRIKLQEGKSIPRYEELRGKKYCKWHHSWSHRTGECFAFKKQIKKELDEGQLIFADQEKRNTKVDTNPSPPQVNMVNPKEKKPM